MHISGPISDPTAAPAYGRNIARACAANVTGQDTFSRLGCEPARQRSEARLIVVAQRFRQRHSDLLRSGSSLLDS
jgi:hypothetical protein